MFDKLKGTENKNKADNTGSIILLGVYIVLIFAFLSWITKNSSAMQQGSNNYTYLSIVLIVFYFIIGGETILKLTNFNSNILMVIFIFIFSIFQILYYRINVKNKIMPLIKYLKSSKSGSLPIKVVCGVVLLTFLIAAIISTHNVIKNKSILEAFFCCIFSIAFIYFLVEYLYLAVHHFKNIDDKVRIFDYNNKLIYVVPLIFYILLTVTVFVEPKISYGLLPIVALIIFAFTRISIKKALSLSSSDKNHKIISSIFKFTNSFMHFNISVIMYAVLFMFFNIESSIKNIQQKQEVSSNIFTILLFYALLVCYIIKYCEEEANHNFVFGKINQYYILMIAIYFVAWIYYGEIFTKNKFELRTNDFTNNDAFILCFPLLCGFIAVVFFGGIKLLNDKFSSLFQDHKSYYWYFYGQTLIYISFIGLVIYTLKQMIDSIKNPDCSETCLSDPKSLGNSEMKNRCDLLECSTCSQCQNNFWAMDPNLGGTYNPEIWGVDNKNGVTVPMTTDNSYKRDIVEYDSKMNKYLCLKNGKKIECNY